MKQIIHSFLCGGTVWAACAVSQGVKAGGTSVSAAEDGEVVRPNIVCVVCEDISPWLRCFGDSVAVTPTIDALAAEGVRYTSLYETVGVSAPSRAALITGMYPTHIKANYMRTQGGQIARPPAVTGYDIVLSEGIKCYTELLRAAGYYCTNNPKTDYQFLSPLTAWDECGRQAHWRNRPKGMPFFAIFNTLASHEQKVWESAKDTLYVSPDDVVLPPYYPEDSIVRRDIAVMYSNIYRMDCFVRQMIDELKAAGEWDNTILIFYSDNGGPLPRQKREITEVGTHIPLIIRYPDGRLPAVLMMDFAVSLSFHPRFFHGRVSSLCLYGGQGLLGNMLRHRGAMFLPHVTVWISAMTSRGACAIAVIVISVIILPISPAISR